MQIPITKNPFGDHMLIIEFLRSRLRAATKGEGYLYGNGYVVTWAVAHLASLAQSHEIRLEWKAWRRDSLPTLPESWPLVIYKKTEDQFETVRRILLSPRVARVICATDAGRESTDCEAMCYMFGMRKTAIFAMVAVALSFGQTVRLNGLYLTMQRLGGSYTPTYYWFMPDGHVMSMAPDGGLTAADFQATCQKYPAYCGTFRQAGDQVSIMVGGSTRTVKVNAAPGGFQFDGLATIKADPIPAGTKLNGNYSGSGPRVVVSTGSGSSVSSAYSFQFMPDGTYKTESVGATRTSVASQASTAAANGTYGFNGTTLELTSNGQKVRHLAFFPYDGAIVIDGVICSKRR